jgi:hypothetical protein
MLTSREAFKTAFISRCIEEGFTSPQQVHQRVKLAMEKLQAVGTEKKAIPGLGSAVDAIGRLGSAAVPLALAAPPVLGAGLGYAAARATDIDDTDVDEIRRQELIDELRRQARRHRRKYWRGSKTKVV